MAGSDEKGQGQDSDRPSRRAFTPKWRQRTEASTHLHPNLQAAPEEGSAAAAEAPAGKKKFQPRWRQRAEEVAARDKQQQLSEPSVEEQVAQLGFQPRWRRTSPAPAPTPEPTAPKSQAFQPRWRQRPQNPLPVSPAESSEEPAPGESAEASPAPKFVPRWRQRSEPVEEVSSEPAPQAAPSRGSFTPRWRQRARAEPQGETTPSPSPAPVQEGAAGSLEPGQRRFVPRWRRTAAAAEPGETASAITPVEPEGPLADTGLEAPVPTAPPQGPEAEPDAGSRPSPGLAAHLRARAQRLRELEKAAREQLKAEAEAEALRAAEMRQPPDVPELPLPALPDLPETPETVASAPPDVPPVFGEPGELLGASDSPEDAPDLFAPVVSAGASPDSAPPAAVALGAPVPTPPEPEPSEPEEGTPGGMETDVPPSVALASVDRDFPEPPRTEPEPGEGLDEGTLIALPEPESAVDVAEQEAPRATPVEGNEPPVRKVTLTSLPLEGEDEKVVLPTAEPERTPEAAATSRYLPPPVETPSPTPQPTAPPQYRNPVLQAAQEMVREPQRPRTTPPPSHPAPNAPIAGPSGPAVSPPRPANPVPAAAPARSASGGRTSIAPAPARPPAPEKKRERSVSGEEVATFTRQLSTMIGAGLPLHQALNFFAESGSGGISDIADTLATKIASGFRLSNAMAHFPSVFSDVYVGLIELGETTSHIDEALERLADLMEKQVRLAKRLSSALVYPAFLILVCLAAIAVFLQYVLPTMIPLFQSFGMQLPWPTRMLLWSRHLVWPSVGLFVVLLLAWRWFKPFWLRARRNRARWAVRLDRTLLALPAVGKFAYQLATARILFALATMLDTGLPLLNAMKRCESVAANLEIAIRLEKAGGALKEGDTITEALSQHEVLPPACIHLMAAGEESAHLAEMVQYAARFYEEEVDQSIAQFMSLVEPFIMVVMGVVVAFIVLSAVLPTVQMINQLGV